MAEDWLVKKMKFNRAEIEKIYLYFMRYHDDLVWRHVACLELTYLDEGRCLYC